jgi:TPP-dependent pyruvate/acetoin dehydrogenase alpha subunit
MIDPAALYRQMYRIRRFEETLLENFAKGVFFGTTHTYLGQEANAVGVLAGIQPEDVVFSNHRCHGHFLAYGGSPHALFAELMGKASGVCGGRGGSQHLHWRSFYSNGIQGGSVPIAAGSALAAKVTHSPAVSMVFIGDGTLGQGVVYETLNLSALWELPILFVLEDNLIAQTTPTALGVAGSMPARFAAFGIPVVELDTSDVQAIETAAQAQLAGIRQHSAPRALILHTCRFGPHSKGDDTRSAEEVARLRQARDPLAIQAVRLLASERQHIHSQVDDEILLAYHQAVQDPYPTA